MPWVDLIDYYINLQRGIQTSILFLAGGREDCWITKEQKNNKKKHETTDKRKLKKKIKKALILTLLQILRDVSK